MSTNTPKHPLNECILCGHSRDAIKERLLIKQKRLKTVAAEMEKSISDDRFNQLNAEAKILEDQIEALQAKRNVKVVPISKYELEQLNKKRTRTANRFKKIKATNPGDATQLEAEEKNALALIDGAIAYKKDPVGSSSICSTCLEKMARAAGITSISKNLPATTGGGNTESEGSGKRKTFDDVAGAEEAKEHCKELVEYLKDPTRLSRLGGKVPKGGLFLGPPGTGKTLLARATAGEAGVPFLSFAGSEFVEKYVGVGASRIRDMIKEAKEKAPCIIFIDEIDALGGKRDAEGSNSEREQTLNQLLVEMDGFEGSEGIIFLAATNRADKLDPALLRPGRFDRHIKIGLPHQAAREAILKVHARNKPLAKDVNLGEIAARAVGFSGAELEALLNEAAIRAAKQDGKEAIDQTDISEAYEKIIMGAENSSMILSEDQRLETAWHEAGHALMGHITYLLKGQLHDPVTMVTILPRGNSLGTTWYQAEGERVGHSKNYCLAQLDTLNGGRVGELLRHNGDHGYVSTGASNDMERASAIALKMTRKWLFGKTQIVEQSNYGVSNLDEAKKAAHIHQAETWIKESTSRVEFYLAKHLDILEEMVDALMKDDTLRKEDMNEIFEPLDKIYKGMEMKDYIAEASKKKPVTQSSKSKASTKKPEDK